MKEVISQTPFANLARSDEAKEFYFFIRHLRMSPKDYADLTELQKVALIEQWNQEQKESEKQSRKAQRRGRR